MFSISVYGYADYQKRRLKRAACAVFGGNQFTDTNGNSLNATKKLVGQAKKNNFLVQLNTLSWALEKARNSTHRRITICTRSRNIEDLIDCYNGNRMLPNREKHSKKIEEVYRLMDYFKEIHVQFMPGGNFDIAQAAKFATEAFILGPKIVYTDGSCLSNGQHGACAGAGVFHAPNHPDNLKLAVPGLQTNNRAEYYAAVAAAEQAVLHGVKELWIMTDSKLFCDSINKWIDKWKDQNNNNSNSEWKTTKGTDVKNRDMLERFMKAQQKVKIQVKHVRGHAGHEGNEGAHQLATQAAQEARNASVIPHVSPRHQFSPDHMDFYRLSLDD